MNAGIIIGYENNTFRGSNNITRAESASMIKRVYTDIKTSINNDYLTKLEFMPVKGDEMYSYFGEYNLNTTNADDKSLLKPKTLWNMWHSAVISSPRIPTFTT